MSDPKLLKFAGKQSFILTNLLLFLFFSGFSQTKNVNQRPLTLDFQAGLAIPGGEFNNYADKGMQAGIMVNRVIYKNLALGFSANYHQLDVKKQFKSPDNSWRSLSLGLGPQYTIPFNKFAIQFHGQLGINFINSPALNQQQPGKPDYFDEGDMTVFQLENKQ